MECEPISRRTALIGSIAALGWAIIPSQGFGSQRETQTETANDSGPAQIASAVIPPEVIAAVRSAPSLGIFNVQPVEHFTGQILKCEEIVFASESFLWLDAMGKAGVPWVAICARRWKFRNPLDVNVIRRPDINLRAGSVGRGGSLGRDGIKDGDPGGPGGNARGSGGNGPTFPLPILYLFGEKVDVQAGDPLKKFKLTVEMEGVAGGAGGPGGRGGAGGKGHNGNDAEDNDGLDCKRGAGNGGNGGRGGAGGNGGPGGAGSNGAEVVYAGPPAFTEKLLFTDLRNTGGLGGQGGAPGRGGQGGKAGHKGNGSPKCHHDGQSGRPGAEGKRGKPGAPGSTGQKGLAALSPMANLDGLY
jgi:hypothetical protein